MIHNIKTFTEVEQYKKTNMTLIHGLMDAIGNLYERRFGWIVSAKAMMSGSKKAVVDEKRVQLLVNKPFYDLWQAGHEPYRAETGWLGESTGWFVDGLYHG